MIVTEQQEFEIIRDFQWEVPIRAIELKTKISAPVLLVLKQYYQLKGLLKNDKENSKD
jgi:hypothetical protein